MPNFTNIIRNHGILFITYGSILKTVMKKSLEK
jgi:hypothetical protein